MPTKKTKLSQSNAPEKTIFLLRTQPSGDAKTTGTPTTKRKEIATNANRAI